MNLSALSSSGFRRYLIGNISGLNASWMFRLTIAWMAWDLSGSAAYVGLISFLVFFPTILGGPVFGVYADRVNIIKAAVIIQSTITFMAFVMLLGLVFDVVSIGFLTVFAFIVGSVFSAYHPIRLSMAPRLVPADQVSSAIGFTAMNFNVSRLTGPAIGGLVIASFGAVAAASLICILYIPFVLVLTGLKPRPRTKVPGRLPFWQSFMEGWQYSIHSKTIFPALLITGLFAVFIRAATEILPVIADGVFHKGPAGLGVLTAAAGVGALLASLMQITMPPPPTGKIPIRALLAVASGPISMFVMAGAQSWPVGIAVIAFIGFASTVVGVNLQTAIQTSLDDNIRGRVMSLWATVAIGGAAIGSLTLGVLIEVVGVTLAFGGIGVASLLVFLTLLYRLRR